MRVVYWGEIVRLQMCSVCCLSLSLRIRDLYPIFSSSVCVTLYIGLCVSVGLCLAISESLYIYIWVCLWGFGCVSLSYYLSVDGFELEGGLKWDFSSNNFVSQWYRCSYVQNHGKSWFYRLEMIFKFDTGVLSILKFIWKLKFWHPEICTWNLWQKFFSKFFVTRNSNIAFDFSHDVLVFI